MMAAIRVLVETDSLVVKTWLNSHYRFIKNTINMQYYLFKQILTLEDQHNQ